MKVAGGGGGGNRTAACRLAVVARISFWDPHNTCTLACLHSEIDYTAEAANAQRFVELYGGLPDIFVPRVYTELSTRKVRERAKQSTHRYGVR